MLIQYQLKGLTGYHSWACMLDSPLAAVRLSVFVTPLIYILGHLNYCIWVTAIICRFSHWRYFDLSNPLGSLIADPLIEVDEMKMNIVWLSYRVFTGRDETCNNKEYSCKLGNSIPERLYILFQYEINLNWRNLMSCLLST